MIIAIDLASRSYPPVVLITIPSNHSTIITIPIIDSSLNKGKENYKVTASIKVFKDNLVLKDNYKEATSIETKIIVQDENKLYEQIYIITPEQFSYVSEKKLLEIGELAIKQKGK